MYIGRVYILQKSPPYKSHRSPKHSARETRSPDYLHTHSVICTNTTTNHEYSKIWADDQIFDHLHIFGTFVRSNIRNICENWCTSAQTSEYNKGHLHKISEYPNIRMFVQMTFVVFVQMIGRPKKKPDHLGRKLQQDVCM